MGIVMAAEKVQFLGKLLVAINFEHPNKKWGRKNSNAWIWIIQTIFNKISYF